MDIIDCHTHLEEDLLFFNIKEYLKIINKFNISKIITSSTTPKSWKRSIYLSNNNNKIYSSIGIHPWFATEENLQILKKNNFTTLKSIVAIGEIGLDKKCNTNFELQIELFERQLHCANTINKPVVIHCVGAYNELIKSLKKIDISKNGGIIHNFSSSKELAKDLSKYNLKFSLNSILKNKLNEKKIKMIQSIYPDNLLLETDISNLNNLDELDLIYENFIENFKTVSKIVDINLKELKNQININAKTIFNI